MTWYSCDHYRLLLFDDTQYTVFMCAAAFIFASFLIQKLSYHFMSPSSKNRSLFYVFGHKFFFLPPDVILNSIFLVFRLLPFFNSRIIHRIIIAVTVVAVFDTSKKRERKKKKIYSLLFFPFPHNRLFFCYHSHIK